jgi:exopolysaccharide biosynthesis polyprenyl glycosylphosphotransferase
MVNEFQERRPAAVGRARAGRSSPRSPGAVLVPGGGLAGPPPAAQGHVRASRLVPVLALPIADSLGLAAAGASSSDSLSATIYALAVLVALSAGGLHRLRICLRVSDQIGRILAAAALPLLLLLPFLPTPGAARLALISAGLVITFRLLTCALLRTAHRHGLLTEPTLVIGSGTFGAHLAEQLRLHPELGLRVAGFLDAGNPRRDLREPSLGRPEDLARVVAALGIRRVIVCFGDWRDEDLVAILRSGRRLAADVCVVPRLHEVGLAVPAGCLDEVWGITLIPLRQIGRSRSGMGLKRAFDVAVAAVLLATALPLLLVLAVVIRLQSGQSPIFRQLRVTGDGRQAEVLKLRTITSRSAAGPDSDTSWSVDSGQLSALGRVLRASHFDELPQLVNVLRGDMSLVGPRPERPYFADRFARQIPRYGDRDRMRAGLTGLAQVHGLHGDTSIAERSRFDNTYIEYWSPWLDMVILVKTVGSALAGLGAGR